jgi:hypothetical protein
MNGSAELFHPPSAEDGTSFRIGSSERVSETLAITALCRRSQAPILCRRSPARCQSCPMWSSGTTAGYCWIASAALAGRIASPSSCREVGACS